MNDKLIKVGKSTLAAVMASSMSFNAISSALPVMAQETNDVPVEEVPTVTAPETEKTSEPTDSSKTPENDEQPKNSGLTEEPKQQDVKENDGEVPEVPETPLVEQPIQKAPAVQTQNEVAPIGVATPKTEELPDHPDILRVTATSAHGSTPIANSFDGNPATYTDSDYGNYEGANPQVYTIELRETKLLNNVVFTPRQDGTNGRVDRMVVEVSTDGSNYKKVGEGAINVDSTAATTISCTESEAKFVRLSMTSPTFESVHVITVGDINLGLKEKQKNEITFNYDNGSHLYADRGSYIIIAYGADWVEYNGKRYTDINYSDDGIGIEDVRDDVKAVPKGTMKEFTLTAGFNDSDEVITYTWYEDKKEPELKVVEETAEYVLFEADEKLQQPSDSRIEVYEENGRYFAKVKPTSSECDHQTVYDNVKDGKNAVWLNFYIDENGICRGYLGDSVAQEMSFISNDKEINIEASTVITKNIKPVLRVKGKGVDRVQIGTSKFSGTEYKVGQESVEVNNARTEMNISSIELKDKSTYYILSQMYGEGNYSYKDEDIFTFKTDFSKGSYASTLKETLDAYAKKDLKEEDYTEDSWSTYSDALKAATASYYDLTNENAAMKEAEDNLNKAFGSLQENNPVIAPESISIGEYNRKTVLLKEGQTIQLKPVVTPAEASQEFIVEFNKTIKPDSEVKLSDTGLITAVKQGSEYNKYHQIYVRSKVDPDVYTYINVTVAKPPVMKDPIIDAYDPYADVPAGESIGMNEEELTFTPSGSVEANEHNKGTLIWYDNGKEVGRDTTRIDRGVYWKDFDIELGEGKHSITYKFIDGAGQESEMSNPVEITRLPFNTAPAGSNKILSYVGKDPIVTIPTRINGQDVVELTSDGYPIPDEGSIQDYVTEVTIPSSITTIDPIFFNHATSLTKLTFEGNMPDCGALDLSKTALEQIIVPSDQVDAYIAKAKAEGWDLPSGVESAEDLFEEDNTEALKALNDKIAKAEEVLEIHGGKYGTEYKNRVAKFKEAIQAAKDVAAKQDVTSKECEEATNELQAAMDEYSKRDTTKLQAEIEKYKDFTSTHSTYKYFEKQMNTAKKYLENPDSASQYQIDSTAINIETKVYLVKVAELNSIYSPTSKTPFDYSKYTVESAASVLNMYGITNDRTNGNYSEIIVQEGEDYNNPDLPGQMKGWYEKYQEAIKTMEASLIPEDAQYLNAPTDALQDAMGVDKKQGTFKVVDEKQENGKRILTVQFINTGIHPIYGKELPNANGSTKFEKFSGKLTDGSFGCYGYTSLDAGWSSSSSVKNIEAIEVDGVSAIQGTIEVDSNINYITLNYSKDRNESYSPWAYKLNELEAEPVIVVNINGTEFGGESFEGATQKAVDAGLIVNENFFTSLEFVSGTLTPEDLKFLDSASSRKLTSLKIDLDDDLKYSEEEKKLPNNLMESATKLEEVSLAGWTSLGKMSLYGTANLKSVNVPDVEVVGYDAFGGRTGLESISLPKAKVLEQNAFYNAEDLKSIDLPVVETIKGSAFYRCVSLTDVTFPATLKTLEGTRLGYVTGSGSSEKLNVLNVTFKGATAPTMATNALQGAPGSTVTVPAEGIASYYGENVNNTGLFTRDDINEMFRQWNIKADEHSLVTYVVGETETMAFIPSGETIGNDRIPEVEVPEGQKFVGWNTKEDGSGDLYTDLSEVPNDVKVYPFFKETIAPVVQVTYSNNNGSQVTKEDVTVTLTANEAIQDIEGWKRVNETTLEKTFSENGKHTVTVTDLAGNTTNVEFEVKRIDKVAPDIEGINDGDVTNEAVTYKVVEQSISKIVVDGTEYNEKNAPYTITEEGKHTIQVIDKAGNDCTVTFTIDLTAPKITVKDSSKGKNGVYSRLDLQFYDANKVDYVEVNGKKKDFGNDKYSDLNHKNAGYVEGKNTVVLYDVAGNSTTLEFVLDTKVPTITVKDSSVGKDGIYKKLDLKFFDQNKVDYVEINGKKKDLSDDKYGDLNHQNAGYVEGKNVVVVYDVAGNSTTLEFVLDTKGPKVEITYSNNNGSQVTRENVKVTLTANESIQDIDGWTRISDAVLEKEFSENGKHTVTVTDLIGNTTDIKFEVKRIDKVEPVIEGIKDGDVTNKAVTYTVKEQSISKIIVDGIEYNEKTAPYTISEEGKHTVQVIDKAGNECTVTFTIDLSKPTAEVTYSEVVDGKQTVTITTDEAVKELDGWTKKDRSGNILTKTYDKDAEEVVYVEDLAGNKSEAINIKVKVSPEETPAEEKVAKLVVNYSLPGKGAAGNLVIKSETFESKTKGTPDKTYTFKEGESYTVDVPKGYKIVKTVKEVSYPEVEVNYGSSKTIEFYLEKEETQKPSKPEKPSDENKPADKDKETSKDKGTNTGVGVSTGIFAGLASISALGLGVLETLKRRKK